MVILNLKWNGTIPVFYHQITDHYPIEQSPYKQNVDYYYRIRNL